MQQLSGLDNSFLIMEAGGQLGHVASLAFYDTSTLEGRAFIDVVEEVLTERLPLMPPYRRRLVEVPLGLDRPYWIDDPDFDLDFHLRHIAVPPPGDERQISELVARLHSRPLDRSRPLWEAYVIEIPQEDRVAFYTKIHHATIDGVSGAQLSEIVMDRVPGAKPKQTAHKEKREPLPTQAEMFARGVAGAAVLPVRTARTILNTVRTLLPGGDDNQPVDADPVPQTPAPRTPWNATITPHRRFAYFSHPLDAYKRVKNTFGTTLNDVVMAVTSGALRRYLEERHALPKEPLVAMVPVSVRTEEEARDFTNRVTSILCQLASDQADPVERLMRIHEFMKTAKRMQQATPANLLQDWSEVAMPALLGQAARIAARTRIMDRVNPPLNVVISNVPGPREALYLGKAQMESYYPVSAVADGQGLNVTVTSYRDHLDWGLVSCRELVPDLWDLPEMFTAALDELMKAAEEREGASRD